MGKLEKPSYEELQAYVVKLENKVYRTLRTELINRTLFDIANSLNNIGGIFFLKGELSQALRNYEKSQAYCAEVGNKQGIAVALTSKGILYQEMGEPEKALEFFIKSLVLREEIGNKLDIVNSLFSLIDVNIELDIDQAQIYLKKLQQINEQEENKKVALQCKLSEALILKASNRRKSLTEAEGILEKIVEDAKEETIDHQLTIQALVNLSELLLEELKSTGEEEILEELEKRVEWLVDMAKKQQSYSLMAESFWIKAQLSLVRLKLREARNLLSQAQTIAEEKGLERLARKISSEHDQLLEQMDQWEELIAKDPRYGCVVCRCETVTEGEIVESIRRGAKTLQGVMFRARAGMGRCQRNWCGSKIVEILARELEVPARDVTYKGRGFSIALG